MVAVRRKEPRASSTYQMNFLFFLFCLHARCRAGANTDGCDPDSSWNVYIAHNHFSTGDDCIAIKVGWNIRSRPRIHTFCFLLADSEVFLFRFPERLHDTSVSARAVELN